MIFYISLLYLRLREENTGLSKWPNLLLKVRDIPSLFRNLICLVPSLGQLSPEEVGRGTVRKMRSISWVIPHCSRFRLFHLLLLCLLNAEVLGDEWVALLLCFPFCRAFVVHSSWLERAHCIQIAQVYPDSLILCESLSLCGLCGLCGSRRLCGLCESLSLYGLCESLSLCGPHLNLCESLSLCGLLGRPTANIISFTTK